MRNSSKLAFEIRKVLLFSYLEMLCVFHCPYPKIKYPNEHTTLYWTQYDILDIYHGLQSLKALVEIHIRTG